MRPAGGEARLGGQSCKVLIVRPQGIGLDVFDDHPPPQESGCSTGARGGTDRGSVKRLIVEVWKPGRGPQQQVATFVVEQQDGAEDGRILGLNRLDDGPKHRGQRIAAGDQGHGSPERAVGG